MPKKIGIGKFNTVAQERHGSDLQSLQSDVESDAEDDQGEKSAQKGALQKKRTQIMKRRNTLQTNKSGLFKTSKSNSLILYDSGMRDKVKTMFGQYKAKPV